MRVVQIEVNNPTTEDMENITEFLLRLKAKASLHIDSKHPIYGPLECAGWTFVPDPNVAGTYIRK